MVDLNTIAQMTIGSAPFIVSAAHGLREVYNESPVKYKDLETPLGIRRVYFPSDIRRVDLAATLSDKEFSWDFSPARLSMIGRIENGRAKITFDFASGGTEGYVFFANSGGLKGKITDLFSVEDGNLWRLPPENTITYRRGGRLIGFHFLDDLENKNL